jgi:hypothetical protein
MTTQSLKYGTEGTVACTVGSLWTSQQFVARSSAAVTNTISLAPDYQFSFVGTIGAGTLGSDKCLYLMFSAGDLNGAFTKSSAEVGVGTDATFTLDNNGTVITSNIARNIVAVNVPSTSSTVTYIGQLSQVGFTTAPPFFCGVVNNFSGCTLTGVSLSFTPVTNTFA